MRSIKIFALFLLFNFILSIVAIQINSNFVEINFSSQSIIISDDTNSLVHLQVDSNEVREIWRKSYGVNSYTTFLIDDINLDGKLEIIALIKNRELQLIDFETSDTIWKFNIPPIATLSANILLGDLTGDGYNEIIISINAQRVDDSFDKAFYILNKGGNLLDLINTDPAGYVGADSISLVDFDSDGIQEIITSYGAGLWNGVDHSGEYRLKYWKWDNKSSKLENIWKINGSDRGGNTAMRIYNKGEKSLIVTAGWYNNEIRVFDINGDLLWQRRPDETYDNESIIQMADTRIEIVDDGSINPHLYAFQNNYWFNYTIKWLDFDLITGELIDTISFKDSKDLIPVISENYLILSIKKAINNNSYTVLSIHVYDIYTKEEIGEFLDNEGNYFKRTVFYSNNPLFILDMKIPPSTLTIDKYGRLWLSSINKNILISAIPFNIINWMEHIEYKDLKGMIINSFKNYQDALLLIIIFLNILALFIWRQYNIFIDTKFHNSFGTDWKLETFKRLKIIFNRFIKLENPEQNLLAINSPDELENEPDDPYANDTISVVGPITNNKEFKNFVGIWLEKHGKDSKKIKAGDIAIIIEFLDVHPKIVNIQQIKERFLKTPASTFYRRVDFLLSIDLLTEIVENSDKQDLRHKKIEISVYGIEFLKSMFSSINFYFQ